MKRRVVSGERQNQSGESSDGSDFPTRRAYEELRLIVTQAGCAKYVTEVMVVYHVQVKCP